MRHARRHRRLNRPLTARKSLLRHLVSGLVLHERITTTFARAKETQRLADHLITWGKEGSLSARREVFDVLQDRTLTKRLFADVAPLFQDRQGGYTRVIRLNHRRGDGAALAMLELVQHTTTAQAPATAKPKKKVVRPPAPVGEAASSAKERVEAPTTSIAETPPAATTPQAAPSAEAPKTGKPKRFLEGLRDIWRRKKTDE